MSPFDTEKAEQVSGYIFFDTLPVQIDNQRQSM